MTEPTQPPETQVERPTRTLEPTETRQVLATATAPATAVDDRDDAGRGECDPAARGDG